jgi:hypothetical protein
VGYHAGCELARDQFEVLYGRPTTRPGGHTRGENGDSLGFCFVGNYDEEEPPKGMLIAALDRAIIPWMMTYDIPIREIHAHRDFSTKSCPGHLFDMGKFRRLAAERMGTLA